MFLVHNLQCYLQLDVLESEYSIFQAALDKTEDFDQVIHEHSIFLKNITTQAFLFPTKVRFLLWLKQKINFTKTSFIWHSFIWRSGLSAMVTRKNNVLI